MKTKEVLPVYCISNFQSQHAKNSADFDIKRLEELVDDFEFTSNPHRHDFYNILFISNGTGTHTIDFVTYEVKPYSIFFLTPGQVHSWALSKDIKGFTIFFTPSFYLMDSNEKKLLDIPFFHSLNNEPCLYLNYNNDSSIVNSIEEIFDENDKNENGSNVVIRAYLDIVMMKLSRYYRKVWTSRQSSQATYQIRELESLIEKYFKKYKLPREYSDLMNLSPKHLNEICRVGLNKTVGDLIQQRVLLESKRLLAYTSKNISEIAEELNFSDKSYFIRFFKKYTSLPPEQFRKVVIG
jgi:AraC-like DNA-binding protein